MTEESVRLENDKVVQNILLELSMAIIYLGVPLYFIGQVLSLAPGKISINGIIGISIILYYGFGVIFGYLTYNTEFQELLDDMTLVSSVLYVMMYLLAITYTNTNSRIITLSFLFIVAEILTAKLIGRELKQREMKGE